MSARDTFLLMFPVEYLVDHVLVGLNMTAARAESSWMDVSIDEFLLWLGLWFFMGLHSNYTSRRDFWSAQDKEDITDTLPRLNKWMSGSRFELILRYLVYTEKPPPQQRDRFWEIRDLVDAWNANMKAAFIPCWLVCIDESMLKHTSVYTPGAIYLQRKFTPRGNEWHTIACSETFIIFGMELVREVTPLKP
jgi:hypothetical protein